MSLPAASFDPKCPVCFGHGQVCDAHPSLAWGPGLPSGYFPLDGVCCCEAGPRPCPCGLTNHEAEEDEPGPQGTRSDLWDMVKWALVAAAITLLFGTVLNLLDRWL